MHIWTIEKWRKIYDLSDPGHRTGIRLRFDNNVDPEVKRACKDFVKWLRSEYFFPFRVPIYLKNYKKLLTRNGDLAYGTFLWPDDPHIEPYIRIAVGDYEDLLKKWGDKDSVLASYIRCIAHELTHYFQWINGLKLTEIGEERQATSYSRYILDEYAETRDHP